jgi:hypothetical protein
MMRDEVSIATSELNMMSIRRIYHGDGTAGPARTGDPQIHNLVL